MSGRIYSDIHDYVYCEKCGSDMWSSRDRNFNGPKCKNKKCDGGLLDAVYVMDKNVMRNKKLKKITNNIK